MVQLVKRSLRKVLGKAHPFCEELLTVLTEVEGVHNSCPLTFVYSDITEEPLTPSHLVAGRRLSTLPNRPCRTGEFHHCGTEGDRNKEAKVGDILIHDDSQERSK